MASLQQSLSDCKASLEQVAKAMMKAASLVRVSLEHALKLAEIELPLLADQIGAKTAQFGEIFASLALTSEEPLFPHLCPPSACILSSHLVGEETNLWVRQRARRRGKGTLRAEKKRCTFTFLVCCRRTPWRRLTWMQKKP